MGLFSSNKVKRKRILTKPQMSLLKNLSRLIDAEGQGPLGLDPLASQAYQNLAGVIGPGPDSLASLMRPGLENLATGNYATAYSTPEREQFLQEAFVDPSRETFEQDILPYISEIFAGRGLEDSGDFMREVLNAGRRVNTDITAQRAQLLQRQQELAPVNMNAGLQLGLAGPNAGLAAGQYRQFAQNPASNPLWGLAPLALGTQPFALTGKSSGGFGGSLLSGLGAIAGGVFGGPGGAMLGSSIGGGLGNIIFG